MRMKESDQVFIVFPSKKTCIAAITAINDDEVFLNLVKWLEEDTELPIEITIASGLPKRRQTRTHHSKKYRTRRTQIYPL